jgi:hypothetical protein
LILALNHFGDRVFSCSMEKKKSTWWLNVLFTQERAIFRRENKIAQGFVRGSLQRGRRRFFAGGSTSSQHFAEVVHFKFTEPPYSDVELMQAVVQHHTGDAEAYAEAFQS